MGRGNLKVDDADKGYTGRPKEKGASVLNNKPIKVLQVTWSHFAGQHVESASEAGCWLKTVRSEESLCS